MPVAFPADHISDQKRFARGEQLLAARTWLRARDHVHHAKWKVMIMAGGAPRGEVNAIRELMPKAHIVAVDNDAACLSAAIDAGVDEIVECDLTDWDRSCSDDCARARPVYDGESRTWRDVVRTCTSSSHARPAVAIAAHGPFDLLVLDLCASVVVAQEIAEKYRRLLTQQGLMLVTFSYGRDVVEVFLRAARRFPHRGCRENDCRCNLGKLRSLGVSESLLGRLCYLFTPAQLEAVESIMTYRGHEMPMCSVLVSRSPVSRDISFVQVEPGDFELAAVYPDAAALYDCPQERIDALRRKFAAIKASLTRAAAV